MEEITDVPFCNDFANAEDNLVSCGKDDCCGMLKEYFIKVDEEGNNSTEIIGRHGCAQDVDHLGHYSATCEENGDSCWEVEDDSLDHDHDDGHTIFRAEICLCGQDRCNNENPIPEIPTTTAAPGPPGPSKTCYNCGYRCTDMHNGACTPKPIDNEGKVPFCGDSATMESSTKQCGGGDECCGALREYFEIEEEGKSRTDMLTFHGCEKDLAGAIGSHVEVICKEHANSCFNVSTENIQDEFLTSAAACFCEGDLCNKDLPDLPFPPPLPSDDPSPTDGGTTPTPCPECTKCYDCGYKKNGIDGEMEEITDVPFCNDFANAEDNLVSCGKDDCCGMLKEYFIKVDEEGNNSTEIIGRHGCAQDVDHLGHYSATCEENGDSCWEVEDDSLDHDHDDGHTIFRAEICLCGLDRCNNENPIPEIPTTTPAPGSASHIASAILTVLLALILQI